MADVVYVNVGGIVYTTSKSTLGRYPDSMLGSMFSGRMDTTKDKNGYYFIDRNGAMFQHVLEFLRQGKLVLPNGFKEYDLLECEADFYQIPALTKDVIRKHRDEKTHEKSQHEFIVMEITNSNYCSPPAADEEEMQQAHKSVKVNIYGPQHITTILNRKLNALGSNCDEYKGVIEMGRIFYDRITQASIISQILSIPGFRFHESGQEPQRNPYPMIDIRQKHVWFVREN